MSELKTSIKMLTKASNLVTLAENVRTQSNYEKAQKAIKKLDSRLFSKDINVLNTRLDNIKKEDSIGGTPIDQGASSGKDPGHNTFKPRPVETNSPEEAIKSITSVEIYLMEKSVLIHQQSW